MEVPIGTIVAYAGPTDTIPEGWLPCDGRELHRKGDFANLFDAIGTCWGGTATDKFNIPDLLGYFLRGVDGGSGNDPDAAKRRDGAGNKILGPVVGSYQRDALKSHNHGLPPHGHENVQLGGSSLVQNFQQQYTFQTEPSAPEALETRPKNAAVYWIIRVK